MQYTRILNLKSLLEKKSHFLLGPRATGKSFLIRKELSSDAIIINLLRGDLLLRLTSNPGLLEEIIDAELAKEKSKRFIVIDEVQKIPSLLDEVHRLIEERRLKFLLTGSSARKLKHGNANLLAGRAWTSNFFPLCWPEIPNFDLDRYLRFGGLPVVYPSDDANEELHAYVSTYLYEEIQAEGLVRKLPQFSRFLTTAALSNGQLINFAQVASDAESSASTVKEHFQILKDTLLGFCLEPWIGSKKRKAISTAKFFLFDTGVTHALAGTQNLDRNSDLYGKSFEQWIVMELRAYLDYRRRKDSLCFWRSTHNEEVDLIIGDHTAIEVKATRKVSSRDFKGLVALSEEKKLKKFILVSQDPIEKKANSIHCMHWKSFMTLLWGDQILPQ